MEDNLKCPVMKIRFSGILFILFIVVHPQLPNVYLKSLSVSNFTISDNHFAGIWDLRLQFQNSYLKMSLHYDRVLFTLYNDRESLSEMRLPPFMMIASAIADQRQKIKQYKLILSSVLSSNDLLQSKHFIDHILSDDVPLVVSRQILQSFAQELGRLESETQKEIALFTLTQIQPRVVSFEEQIRLSFFDLGSCPRLQWLDGQIGFITLISRRNLAVLQTISVS